MLNKRNNILEFTIETAAPMKSGFKNEITQIIREKTGSADVKIKTCVRPELLGGYLLRADDFYIDATLRDQADKMMKHLISGVKLSGAANA
jgi:F0F1-type ATP synthase delta subunit